MEFVEATNEQALEWLLKNQDELFYARLFVEGGEPIRTFHWIRHEGEDIGFINHEVLSGSGLAFHDDDYVMDMVEPGQVYHYIDTFNILDSYQGMGLGKEAVKYLKEYIEGRTLVYVTEDSYEFWEKFGFSSLGSSEWWMIEE